MKCISKLNSLLRSKSGFAYVQAIIVILVLLIVGVAIIVVFNIQLQAIEIKKTVRMEMNNLSAIIVEDTYNATKHGSVTEYLERLHSSSEYKNHLLDVTVNNISSNLGLTKKGSSFARINEKGNTDYSLSKIKLEQENTTDKIKYTINLKVTLNVKMLGKYVAGFDQLVSYETHHVKNY